VGCQGSAFRPIAFGLDSPPVQARTLAYIGEVRIVVPGIGYWRCPQCQLCYYGVMATDDHDSWRETLYLLRSPENARRLMEAVARDKAPAQQFGNRCPDA
jgi:hypothetical protein